MKKYGIVYKIVDPPDNRPRAGKFGICISHTESWENQEGFIGRPRLWVFPIPIASGFKFEKFGASETRGLFGGMSDEQQELYSEAFERAISDVVTATVCEIVDGDDAPSSPKDILIFGPALPKLTGRLASLRLPASIRISWICPVPFPVWIARGVDEKIAIPYYLSSRPEIV